jgi:hypothetical protein
MTNWGDGRLYIQWIAGWRDDRSPLERRAFSISDREQLLNAFSKSMRATVP